jgi:hypothetical protein
VQKNDFYKSTSKIFLKNLDAKAIFVFNNNNFVCKQMTGNASLILSIAVAFVNAVNDMSVIEIQADFGTWDKVSDASNCHFVARSEDVVSKSKN